MDRRRDETSALVARYTNATPDELRRGLNTVRLWGILPFFLGCVLIAIGMILTSEQTGYVITVYFGLVFVGTQFALDGLIRLIFAKPAADQPAWLRAALWLVSLGVTLAYVASVS